MTHSDVVRPMGVHLIWLQLLRLLLGILGCLSLGLASLSGIGTPPALAVPLGTYGSTSQPEILRLTPEVQVAVGYGVSNVSLITGPTGSILIDAADSVTSAQKLLPQFRALSDRPLQAIIYTHSHPDHTGGAQVWVQQFNAAPDPAPAIYARSNFNQTLDRAESLGAIAQQRRDWEHGFGLAARDRAVYFGESLPPPQNIGGGTLPPTHTFAGDHLSLSIGGIALDLVAAPGESPDELYVWLPQQNIVFCGDNYYSAFPNLSAIRGTPYRDVAQWVASLDSMVAKAPEYLVPGHSAPLGNRDDIQRVLGNYSAAIDAVLTQTLEGMNQGLTPDQLVQRVQLPPDLAQLPYLQPVYGEIAPAVRSIFAAYLGWFDGNPTHLNPLAPLVQAQHLAHLAGGITALWHQAHTAAAIEDYLWVLQLTDALHELLGDQTLEITPAPEPGSAEPPALTRSALAQLRAMALDGLADREINTNASNYYRSAAHALRSDPPLWHLGVSADVAAIEGPPTHNPPTHNPPTHNPKNKVLKQAFSGLGE
ncbi:alkyl/aryl-sulfatase [Prochlorothrix hollandica]|uniref:alkyl/aryl-sulfatase n=2 Tax=Prochlorothrix hollandica TaxID=1223 RepID=UPI0013757C5B|nr:alkyl/aryl-sulfatase [Prochlorothrix hollandica]